MSTKFMKFSSLAALALSLSLLTACGSDSKEPTGFAPKTTQSAQPSSTSTKDSASKPSATPTSSSSSSSKSAATSSSTSQKSSTSPAASSAPVASSQVTSSSTPDASPTDTVSSQSTSSENLESKQESDTSQTTTNNSTIKSRSDLKPVSPGAAAGNWSGVGKLNDDGTFEGSELIIVSAVPKESGIIYLDAVTGTGSGFYIHYYPAGVKIPFEQFEDPTDVSRDRLIHGNSYYLTISKERFEEIQLRHILYRE